MVRDAQLDADTPVAEAGASFLLRPGIAFLNHGSYGACPRPVFDTFKRWQRTLEEQPVEFLGRRLHGLLAEARERLAAYVGTSADALVFVPNATHDNVPEMMDAEFDGGYAGVINPWVSLFVP